MQGLAAANTNRPARASFDAAIATYTGLVARDSLAAEAWYGLADSYFHARSRDLPRDSLLPYLTHALRGFERTLAVDSTFRLAYSHLVQLYNLATLSDVAFLRDSAVPITDPTAATTAALRDSAQRRGLQIAKAWVRADDGSVQSTLQLSQSFDAAGQRDSALAVLRDALPLSQAGSPTIRMNLLQLQVQHGDTGIASTLRYVLDHYTADSLQTIGIGQRFSAIGFMVSAAAVTGNSADLQRAVALFERTDPTLPFSTVQTAPFMALSRRTLGIAMGEPVTPEMERQLLLSMRVIDTMPVPVGPQVRDGSVSLPLLAFLSTRDTAYVGLVRRWSNAPWPDLDALIALDRGDTATAERIAATFSKPDSLRNPAVRFGAGGLRAIARAEVLARLGLHRQAAETYEAIDVHRVNRAGLAEPGYTVLVRSLLTRARLWRQLGERDKAIASYEEFLRRWKHADGAALKQVVEARQELAAVRDAPATRTP